MTNNPGWVNVGVDHDTADFADSRFADGGERWATTLSPHPAPAHHRRWRRQQRVAHALWKLELQRLADKLASRVDVDHLPPGTSKWNKIEHRLFSFITQNWRAKPLVSYGVIVDLIAATTTQTGLKVLCELDDKSYPKGIVVSNEEMASLNIKRADFHGEWNYTIAPSNQSRQAVVS